ncbi:hypothetical protein [Streptomyces sp. DW26H14]|uniref:hypothetical protein n=1 Tax=Streptomyces sp. DW26H14 TaxID=3435395 RepID=UPI00403DDBFB
MKTFRIFGYEPVVVLNALSAALGLVVSLGVTPLTAPESGGIVAFVTAALGAVAAWRTRPVVPQVFTTVVAAGADLAATFGFHAGQGLIGGVNGAVLALLTLLTRGQVTPTAKLRRPKPVASA